MSTVLSSKWTKVVLFLLCLVPLEYLLWRAYQGRLTANPIEYITHFTGDWILRFLVITLTVTPLRNILNEPKLTRFRRMLGLFAYFYACLHLLIWSVVDKQLDPQIMWQDILKRWYITVGMAGLLAMTPLAITSTAGWVRRMGYKRWQKLHRLVYATAVLGVAHYYLLVKSDIRLPVMYGVMVAILLIYRIVKSKGKNKPALKRMPAAAAP